MQDILTTYEYSENFPNILKDILYLYANCLADSAGKLLSLFQIQA